MKPSKEWLEWFVPSLLLAAVLFALWSDTSPKHERDVVRIDVAQWLPSDGIDGRQVKLPHSLDDEPPPFRDFATYFLKWPEEISYTIDGEDPPHLGILIPRVGSQFALYVNGTEIAQYGWRPVDEEETFLAVSEPHLASIPAWILSPNPKENRIAFEVRGIPLDRAGLSPVIIGDYGDVQLHHAKLLFWQNTMTSASALIGAVVCIVGFYVWQHLRHPAYWLTSVCAGAFGARSSMLMNSRISVPYEVFFYVDRLLLVVLGALFILTIERFLRNDTNPAPSFRHIRRAAWLSGIAAAALLTCSVVTGEYVYVKYMAGILTATSAVCLAWAAVVTALRGEVRDEKALIFVGACFVLITGIRDFAVIQLGAPGDGDLRWMVTGSMALLIIFGIVLARQTVSATTALRALSDSLSERIAEREKELRDAYNELRAKDAMEHRQNERQRIMRDLHDGLGSQLSSAILTLERQIPRNTPGRLPALRLVNSAMQNLRLTLDSLEPHEGSIPTLMGMVRRRMRDPLDAAGIKLDWKMEFVQPLDYLDDKAALDFIFLIQEALTNAIKHSGATRLQARVYEDEQEVHVVLQDNGRGALGEQTRSSDDCLSGGRGLANMRERARRCGAHLEFFDANPGFGIKVSFSRDGNPVARDTDLSVLSNTN